MVTSKKLAQGSTKTKKKNENLVGAKNDSFEMEEVTVSYLKKSHKPKYKETLSEQTGKNPCHKKCKELTDSQELTQIAQPKEFLGVIVHRCDRIRSKLSLSGLSVRVHLMNISSSEYMKSTSNVSPFPITPVITKPLLVGSQELFLPVWEELIIFNEDILALSNNQDAILFFEILEIPNYKLDKQTTDQTCELYNDCNVIAWAFLLLMSPTGRSNIRWKKQRLQLFEPITKRVITMNDNDESKINIENFLNKIKHSNLQRTQFCDLNSIESGLNLLSYWNTGKANYRIPYPSSIYVTVKGIKMESTNNSNSKQPYLQNTRKSLKETSLKLVDWNEKNIETNLNNTMENELNSSDENIQTNEIEQMRTVWMRKSEQPCRVPNILVGYGITTSTICTNETFWDSSVQQYMNTKGKSCGVHCVSFSPDGKWLAVSVARRIFPKSTTSSQKNNSYSLNCAVLLFKYPPSLKRNQPHLELSGHSGIIYSLSWAQTPIIVQRNRDTTNILDRNDLKKLKQVWLLASGSADGTVRVWRLCLNQLNIRTLPTNLSINKQTINHNITFSQSNNENIKHNYNDYNPIQVGDIVNYSIYRKGVLCSVLGHPNFVYAVSFRKNFETHSLNSVLMTTNESEMTALTNKYVLATGCYDQYVRIWLVKHNKTQLLQELNGPHQSHINTVTFSNDGKCLYSGDAKGIIAVWRDVQKSSTDVKQTLPFKIINEASSTKWMFEKIIDLPDLKNCIINHLECHPTQNSLLVHTRDDCLKLVDLRTNFISARFHGSINSRDLLRSCITPCGSFLFSGSEDGNVYVWNLSTGDQVTCYKNLDLSGSITTISYHPTDNVVTFASLGLESPVLFYAYDPTVSHKIEDPLAQSNSTTNMDLYRSQLKKIKNEAHKKNAERLLHVMAKLDTVTVYSKHLSNEMKEKDSIHKSEWRPKFTVINENSSTQNLKSDTDSGINSIRSPKPKRSNSVENYSDMDQNIFAVLFDYEAQRSDELSVCQGDCVKILYRDTPKWWMARLVRTGQEGFIQSNYLTNNFNSTNEITSQQSDQYRNQSGKIKTCKNQYIDISKSDSNPIKQNNQIFDPDKITSEKQREKIEERKIKPENLTPNPFSTKVLKHRRISRPLPEGGDIISNNSSLNQSTELQNSSYTDKLFAFQSAQQMKDSPSRSDKRQRSNSRPLPSLE